MEAGKGNPKRISTFDDKGGRIEGQTAGAVPVNSAA
jgi:hypothetical protein